jgi:hypothetical protein
MLKEGIEAVVITETLKKKYIDPLLEAPKKKSENKTVEEPMTSGRVKGMTDFTSYPAIPSGVKKISRARRSLLLQKITKAIQQPNIFYPPIQIISHKPSETFQNLHLVNRNQQKKRSRELKPPAD